MAAQFLEMEQARKSRALALVFYWRITLILHLRHHTLTPLFLQHLEFFDCTRCLSSRVSCGLFEVVHI